MSSSEARALIEELEEEYAWVPIIAPPEAMSWSLQRIRAYFDEDEPCDELAVKPSNSDLGSATQKRPSPRVLSEDDIPAEYRRDFHGALRGVVADVEVRESRCRIRKKSLLVAGAGD